MKKQLPYDETNAQSILDYAKKLEGKTLRKVLPIGEIPNEVRFGGKGKLGQLVEEAYFYYPPNSDSEPDFPKAGIELKTTPILKNSKGWRAKERLSLSKINFSEDHKYSFYDSRIWKKNARLLLFFYVHQSGVPSLDLFFKIIRLWDFPKEDLKTIEKDFEIIRQKILDGKAHEISEGDTNYLGASTKGSTREKSMQDQPFSKIKAPGRGFSLKPTYINLIIDDSLGVQREKKDSGSLIKKASEIKKGESFEDVVIRKFKPFLGKTEEELLMQFGLENSNSKSKNYQLAKLILGVDKKKIEEFEKADISLKTVRLEKNGKPKESMSFAQIKFKEIVNKNWEGSYWEETVNKRHFFVVFQKDDNDDFRLKKIFFWTMSFADRKVAKAFWQDTKQKIRHGDFDNFIKMSDDKICHVRPKGRNSNDLMETHLGTMEKKKCYWLNRDYIAKVIAEN